MPPSDPRTEVLAEYETRVIRRTAPAPDVRRRLDTVLAGRLELTWLTDDQLRIRTRDHVGVVRLPDGLTIRIEPKFVGSDLDVLTMLAYTGHLDPEQLELLRDLSSSPDGSLVDLLCRLVLDATLAVAAQGVIQDYHDASADLGILRGRLDLKRQLGRHFGRGGRPRLRLSGLRP